MLLNRGHDGDILDHLLKGMAGVEKRDIRCANPKATTALSNRVFIIDPANTELVAAWATVKTALQAAQVATV